MLAMRSRVDDATMTDKKEMLRLATDLTVSFVGTNGLRVEGYTSAEGEGTKTELVTAASAMIAEITHELALKCEVKPIMLHEAVEFAIKFPNKERHSYEVEFDAVR